MALKRGVTPVKMLRRLLAILVVASPFALTPAPAAAADDPIIRMVQCAFPMSHHTSVAAGSPITLIVGWAMATRGNLESFVRAATVTFTIDGNPVTPTQSEFIPLPGPHFGTGAGGWRVFWSFSTTAPALGHTIVWTTGLTLSHAVTDHELGLGKPVTIPAGILFSPAQLYCNITGV